MLPVAAQLDHAPHGLVLQWTAQSSDSERYGHCEPVNVGATITLRWRERVAVTTLQGVQDDQTDTTDYNLRFWIL